MGWVAEPGSVESLAGRVRRLLQPVWASRESLSFLDVGCGLGLMVAVLGALGARSATGLSGNRDGCRVCVELKRRCAPFPIDFALGRAEALPFRDHGLDVVFCVEAISHFIEPWRFLDEAWRVLRPGGYIIIADDNNGANSGQRRELEEIWQRFEEGPPTDNIHGHRLLLPYVESRRAILRRNLPEATEDQVARLSRETSGLWGARLVETAQRSLQAGVSPGLLYRRGTCPVEPVNGVLMENALDPREVGSFLREKGARVEVRPYFGGETRGGIVRLADSLLRRALPSSVTLRFAPGYRIQARKVGTSPR